ncbi:c-type heme family protein [Allochromatium vinosum]|uniref:c-type heme family protein n=1 Tax=Allochromatium vinosum TaxID=1049 RepID=UPI0001A79A4E|nr:DUF3365 domain-containing protein [Allochromatium vinosum]
MPGYANVQEGGGGLRAALQLRLKLSLVLGLWLVIVAGSLDWNLYQAAHHREELSRESARSFFDLLLITRSWNARHEGVYVPVTPETPPNPYLKHPQRDLHANSLTLTKINPAYMTRILAEWAAERSGVRFHITSLKPIRPENAAHPWEVEALRAFEPGAREWRLGHRWGMREAPPRLCPNETWLKDSKSLLC